MSEITKPVYTENIEKAYTVVREQELNEKAIKQIYDYILDDENAISSLGETVNENYNTEKKHYDEVTEKIDTLTTNLEEATTRTSADTALQAAIDTNTANIATNATNIANNTDTITSLINDLETEETTRTSADTALQAAIDTNTANIATNATNIANNTDTITSLINDLETEETTRTSADTALQKSIDKNKSNIDTNKDNISYLEAKVDDLENDKVNKSGDTMTGSLEVSTTSNIDIGLSVTKEYNDNTYTSLISSNGDIKSLHLTDHGTASLTFNYNGGFIQECYNTDDQTWSVSYELPTTTIDDDGQSYVLLTQEAAEVALNKKQDKLVSGTNIKTINGNSLLGSGNITIEGGSGGTSVNLYNVNIKFDAGKLGYEVLNGNTATINFIIIGTNCDSKINSLTLWSDLLDYLVYRQQSMSLSIKYNLSSTVSRTLEYHGKLYINNYSDVLTNGKYCLVVTLFDYFLSEISGSVPTLDEDIDVITEVDFENQTSTSSSVISWSNNSDYTMEVVNSTFISSLEDMFTNLSELSSLSVTLVEEL